MGPESKVSTSCPLRSGYCCTSGQVAKRVIDNPGGLGINVGALIMRIGFGGP